MCSGQNKTQGTCIRGPVGAVKGPLKISRPNCCDEVAAYPTLATWTSGVLIPTLRMAEPNPNEINQS